MKAFLPIVRATRILQQVTLEAITEQSWDINSNLQNSITVDKKKKTLAIT